MSNDEGVVGFAIAVIKPESSTIEILDVDRSLRRSAGIQREVVVAGQTFTVGIGHGVLAALLPHLPRPTRINAANASSQYLCRSLGFVQRPDTRSPCLLMWPTV